MLLIHAHGPITLSKLQTSVTQNSYYLYKVQKSTAVDKTNSECVRVRVRSFIHTINNLQFTHTVDAIVLPSTQQNQHQQPRKPLTFIVVFITHAQALAAQSQYHPTSLASKADITFFFCKKLFLFFFCKEATFTSIFIRPHHIHKFLTHQESSHIVSSACY